MKRASDQEIIKKIKGGQINYFEEIVIKYTKPIYSFVSRKLFDREEADDLVQISFIKFYKSIYSFDDNKPVLPYLYEIAKNELKMYFRSKKNTVPLDPNIKYIQDDEIFDSLELDTLLKKLPKKHRKIFIMLSDGFSNEEIAIKMNKPLNTIKTIIRRGRMKLRSLAPKSASPG